MTRLSTTRIYFAAEDGELTIDALLEITYIKIFSNDVQVTDSVPDLFLMLALITITNVDRST